MEQEAQISLWNSLESDTESLAQERLYQMELQNRIHQKNEIVNPGVEGHTDRQLEQSGEEHEEDYEDDSKEDKIEEDNDIYDSLEVAAFRLGKRATDDTEVHEIRKEDMFRHACGEDEYAALRYDPNWRNKLKGAQLFGEGRNQLSQEEEGSRALGEPYDESPWKVGDHTGSGEQKKLARRQAPAMGFVMGVTTDHRSESKLKLPPTPYYLSSRNNSAFGEESPPSERQRPCEPLDRVEGAGWKAVPAARDQTHADENKGISCEQEETYEEVNKRYTKEYQHFYEQESARTDETSNNNQDNAHYKLKQYRRLSNTRQSKPKEDIVERNKITLGVRTKRGSYLCAHGQKDAKDHNDEQESEVVEEISSISSQGSQRHLLDPELRWQQKTQRLKVYREKKKGWREGNHQHPSLPITSTRAGDQSEGANSGAPQDRCIGRGRSRRRHRGHANGPVVGEVDPVGTVGTPLSSALPTPQRRPDHSPYTMRTPTLNLNISLNASTDVTPFLEQDPRQTSINLSPHHGLLLGARPGAYHQTPVSCQYDYLVNPAQVAYYGPGYQPTVPQAALFSMVPTPNWVPGQQNQGRPFVQQGSRSRHSGVPPLWEHDSYSVQRMDSNRARIAPTKWQPAAEKNLYLNPGDQHIVLQPQDSQRLSHGLLAQNSRSYTVLPPIGETVANDSELSSQNSGQKINAIKRSSSDGYLAQLEKQKQLKEKIAYKEYTLKDYKALKQDVKLGGLGPNYKVTEIEAEKIRQQKQYSNKVRDHNKSISRIPFLPARNRGGRDTTEDEIPRRKALEYARSIPKPKPPTEQKSGEKAGKELILHGHVQYLEPQDLSQLARLEMLQKRHEEEKQVVAHFKALRAF
ncbi:hypothetical protein AAFF_G00416710 [Aldrovandia affinis]|uniref:Uncharacterized protein n=1 Tax=Aldrovandia affinis TaxID=143900 RepID=A0AAD7SAI4_9TELE|nr:hypothetical protein AAFF_G00416710 [Aldrovandia affinis]